MSAYKLTIIAGPNRGTSYAIHDGEISIGRHGDNAVVLPSGRVSKKHCVLVVNNEKVTLKDNGSANGTFVNGVLSKAKKLRPGDRISVGEYVMELSQPSKRAAEQAPMALGGMGGNVLQFPVTQSGQERKSPRKRRAGLPGNGLAMGGSLAINGAMNGALGGLPGAAGEALAGGEGARPGAPKDLKGKIIHAFEHQLMPLVYSLNLKNEWRLVGLGLGGALVIGSLLLTISPILSEGQDRVIREAGRRVQFMAKQVVERNAAFLASGQETKLEVGASIEKDPSVRAAVLVDMSLRIIAPAEKVGQYFTAGNEARLAVAARDAYRRGGAPSGFFRQAGESIVGIEPVEVYNRQIAKNEVVGMAIIAVDSALSTLDLGEMGMIYARSLIMTGLLAAFLMLVFYRLTLKPFEELNNDIDKVLKGELASVTHLFKVEELNPLWDVINSALQRVPKNEMQGLGGSIEPAASTGVEDFAGAAQLLGEIARYGLVMCDGERRITYISPMFDDIAGIRMDSQGQDLASVARDQAFGSLVTDIFDRLQPGQTLNEEFDFSGINYRIHASAIGTPGQPAKGYILAAVKVEE